MNHITMNLDYVAMIKHWTKLTLDKILRGILILAVSRYLGRYVSVDAVQTHGYACVD